MNKSLRLHSLLQITSFLLIACLLTQCSGNQDDINDPTFNGNDVVILPACKLSSKVFDESNRIDYMYNENFANVIRFVSYTDDVMTSRANYFYDDLFHIVTITEEFYEASELVGRWKTIMEYNEDDQLIKEDLYEEEPLSEKEYVLRESSVVSYESFGVDTRIRIIRTPQDGQGQEERKKILTIDSNFNVIKEETYQSDTIISETINEYDTNLNPVRTPLNFFYVSQFNRTSSITTRFDNQENYSSQSTYEFEDYQTYDFIKTYDLPAKESFEDSNGLSKTIEYVYDCQ